MNGREGGGVYSRRHIQSNESVCHKLLHLNFIVSLSLLNRNRLKTNYTCANVCVSDVIVKYLFVLLCVGGLDEESRAIGMTHIVQSTKIKE